MLNVGIIGCGAIGSQICKSFDADENRNINIHAIYDHNTDYVSSIINQLKSMEPKILSLDEMVREVDLIVETASQRAVRSIAIPALKAKCDVLIMSVGALAEDKLRNDIYALATQNNCKVYLPSGSIAGIDGIKSAMSGDIQSITLKTKKPPAGLKDAPYIIEQGINLDKIDSETIIFEGSALNAVNAFPANVNVAATLSIAGIGFEKTKVQIIADPKLTMNVHEIEVLGEFGKICSRIENKPSPKNPKTSHLASLSAISTLRKIAEPVQVGT
ncbi:aspartate dehydrogenase [Methanosalsum natronophilum]|nr:aspartate dehydrogenase [Methanosalsum natronophilum]MCS3923127.1 aspartate dehydrogenase [Methanosalsum natronophilum]